MKDLKEQFKKVVDEYIEEFCIKQDIDIDFGTYGGWIGGKGEVICLNDMFFDFSDIRLDIDKQAPKGLIIEWYWANVESDQQINYKSYLMGLRHKDL